MDDLAQIFHGHFNPVRYFRPVISSECFHQAKKVLREALLILFDFCQMCPIYCENISSFCLWQFALCYSYDSESPVPSPEACQPLLSLVTIPREAFIPSKCQITELTDVVHSNHLLRWRMLNIQVTVINNSLSLNFWTSRLNVNKSGIKWTRFY